MADDVDTEPTLAPRLPKRLARWSQEIESACEQCGGLDPFILAAIIDRESLGGDALSPPGPAGTGDNGHGRGLCQIDDRAFADWCNQLEPDGTPTWQVPAKNIAKGAEVLHAALQALGFDYVAAIAAYNCGVHRVQDRLAFLPLTGKSARVAALDSLTTGGNYLSDVLARRDGFLKAVPTSPIGGFA